MKKIFTPCLWIVFVGLIAGLPKLMADETPTPCGHWEQETYSYETTCENPENPGSYVSMLVGYERIHHADWIEVSPAWVEEGAEWAAGNGRDPDTFHPAVWELRLWDEDIEIWQDVWVSNLITITVTDTRSVWVEEPCG